MTARRFAAFLALPCAALLSGCPTVPKTGSGATSSASGPSIRPASGEVLQGAEGLEEAYVLAHRAAEAKREGVKARGYEEFRRGVTRDAEGVFIVNGDTPIGDEKHLREFYDTQIDTDPQDSLRGQLTVNQSGGSDTIWSDAQKRNLSYCVSSSFGARHAAAVADMQAATGAWEAVADVDFHYRADQDASCTAANTLVLFDVRPVSGQSYLARAFFPDDPRSRRNVLIDGSSFDRAPGDTLTLAGILRHELGHSLGFRHEHTRPDSGTCFEDTDWRPLTNYDALSVMHYPQCNGGGDWSLTLTAKDKNGAACLYGAASGFVVDENLCLDPPEPVIPACGPTTVSFSAQTVARGAVKAYGPFAVAQGTTFEAKLSGNGANPGDPDLYVAFGQAPTTSAYACRPYLSGPNEECSRTVPAGASQAFVGVRGFSDGRYDLVVTHSR